MMAKATRSSLEQELREMGYRVTHQRRIILEELKKMDSHPTAKEVYEVVRARLPNISLGTVYRNLSVLEELNLIQKIQYDHTSHYDGDFEKHYHLKCVECEGVYNVHPSVINALDTRLLESQGFELLDYKLELYGRCPICR
jgi:Fe2+ or Zn2+ uptake regulation protein